MQLSCKDIKNKKSALFQPENYRINENKILTSSDNSQKCHQTQPLECIDRCQGRSDPGLHRPNNCVPRPSMNRPINKPVNKPESIKNNYTN